jgi:hypothetical protein
MTDASTTIIEACGDPSLFARWFRQPETWRAWFVFLRDQDLEIALVFKMNPGAAVGLQGPDADQWRGE